MKRAKAWVISAIFLASLTAGAFFVLLYYPRLHELRRLDAELQRVQFDGRTLTLDGRRATDRTAVFNCNTFESKYLGNADLVAVFDSATASLKAKFHQDPQYLIMTDEEGWDQVCAAWDLPDGHAEVVTGSGNDTNYMAVMVGPPDPSKKVRPGSHAAISGIYIR